MLFSRCCICHYIRTSSKPIQVTERCSKDITGQNIHIDESCVKSKLENLNNEKSDTRSTWGSRTYSYNQFPLFHDCSQKGKLPVTKCQRLIKRSISIIKKTGKNYKVYLHY